LDQRLTIVTLGVASVPAARRFYEKLGWTPSSAGQGDDVAFFQMNGTALSLFGRAALAADAAIADSQPGFSGVTLAHNLDSPAAVDAAFAQAIAAGATALKKPETVFWGGYSGYFSDPDGHIWELAHNPFFPLDPDGNLVLPE
jgi:catechol 2,3-dioxygenase-like lactoylglutathione lyase family enzyme